MERLSYAACTLRSIALLTKTLVDSFNDTSLYAALQALVFVRALYSFVFQLQY